MRSNTIFFGWNRSIPGWERTSAEHFQEFVQYLGEHNAWRQSSKCGVRE